MVKLVALLRRKEGLSHDEFLRYWREQHTPLLLGLEDFRRFLKRYVHGVPAGGFAADATGGEPFDAAAEMFFESLEEMGRAFALPSYLETVRPDEERFLDLPRCVALVVTEVEMLDAS